jgi:hypothetical protein
MPRTAGTAYGRFRLASDLSFRSRNAAEEIPIRGLLNHRF